MHPKRLLPLREYFTISLLLLAVATASRAAELVALYEFENPQDLGRDSSGRGNHAEVSQVDSVEGRFGLGGFFDQSRPGSFAKRGGLAGFTGKPGVTLAAWVKLDPSTSGYDGIISQDGGGCCDNRVLLHPDHKVFINLSEHSDRHMTAGPAIVFDEWTHIAMTGLDGDGESEARVYVNGVEVPGSPEVFPEIDDGSTWNTYLGVGESGTAHPLTGALDDVRVYEGALTADEIIGLLNPGTTAFDITAIARGMDGTVELTWMSSPGDFYDVEISGNLTLESWQRRMLSVPAEPEPAILTSVLLPRGTEVGVEYFRVVEIGPPPLLETSFEEGAGEWTSTGDGTLWEFGTPSQGPGAARTGDGVAGTGLAENYVDSTAARLQSPVIDPQGATGLRLTFWHYLDTFDGSEGGQVGILEEDGTLIQNFEPAYTGGPEGDTSEWTEVSIRLPDLDPPRPFRIQFQFLAVNDGDDTNGAGWFIDDLRVGR